MTIRALVKVLCLILIVQFTSIIIPFKVVLIVNCIKLLRKWFRETFGELLVAARGLAHYGIIQTHKSDA